VYAVNECLLNGTSGHLRLFSGAMWDRFTVRDASDRVRVGSDCGLGCFTEKVPVAMSICYDLRNVLFSYKLIGPY